MIAFVKEAEALMEKGQLERLRSDEGEWQIVVLPADAGERSAVFGLLLQQLATNQIREWKVLPNQTTDASERLSSHGLKQLSTVANCAIRRT